MYMKFNNNLLNIKNTHSTSETDVYSANQTNEEIENAVKDVYSTSEVKTNKIWVDGKPIYRKVIELSNVARGYNRHSHNISNLDKVIDISGYWKDSTENNYNSISRVVCDNITTYGTGILNVDATYYFTLVGTGIGTTNKVYIIFEYTKTTD